MKLVDAATQPPRVRCEKDGYRWSGPARRAAASSYCVQDRRGTRSSSGMMADRGIPRRSLLVDAGGKA